MKSPHRPLGFTLIEVVVVVLIVGIMLGAMTFYIGGQDSSLVEEESERLAVLLQAAQEEAILQGDILMLEIVDNGYQFQRLNEEGKFQVIEQDDILHPREMPVGIEMQGLVLEGAPEAQTGILVWPTGEITAFAVNFVHSKGQARWRVEGTANGEIKLARAA